MHRSVSPGWAILFGLFFAASLAPVLTDFNYSDPASARQDHLEHHLPGAVDYSHFGEPHTVHSPNIPGYYFLMGAIRHWITASAVGLRFANLLLTTGLALTICAAVATQMDWTPGPWLVAPLLFSQSIFTRGVWLATDNPPWWGVLAILLIALRGRVRPATLVAAGAIVFATVAVRQNQLWIAAFFVVAAYLAGGVVRAVQAGVAMIPACALVAWYVWRWHGFVPPEFARTHAGYSLAAIPMTFALTGVVGGFYLWTLRLPILNCAGRRRWIIPGLTAGTLAGLIARTDYIPWYRGFGIWLAVQATPVVMGRSLLMLALSILGGLAAALFFMLLRARERWLFGSAALFFMAAQCFHPAEFERYYEPFVLMLLILATARIAARESSVLADRKATLGIAALTFLEAGYTIWRMSIPA